MKKLIAAVGLVAALALTGCSIPVTAAPAPESSPEEPAATQEEAAPEEGTRSNPYPLGTTVTGGDWSLTVNSVNHDATQAVVDANMFNEPPTEGNTYILVNVTLAYTGTDPDGAMPSQIIEYVTVDGNTINSGATMNVAPEQLEWMTTLYEGASISGNVLFEVPAATASEGTLAVKPTMLADKSFVAVQ